MKRYGVLFVAAIAVSLLLVRTGRRPGPPAPEADATRDSVAIAVTLTDHGVEPPRVGVTKDRRVILTIVNRRRLASGVSLQGYQDVVSPGILEPGDRWQGRFLADRPGDDFAWMVEGEPSGRFVVTGSHLVAGHR